MINATIYLENPVLFDRTYCKPYDSAELLSQFAGGMFRSVLHCNNANAVGESTAEYLTTAVDFTPS